MVYKGIRIVLNKQYVAQFWIYRQNFTFKTIMGIMKQVQGPSNMVKTIICKHLERLPLKLLTPNYLLITYYVNLSYWHHSYNDVSSLKIETEGEILVH